MHAALQTYISTATLVCSVAALFFSLLAAFPGLKRVLAAVRDGVLWFALFLVLGGVGFIAWQHVRQPALGITGADSVNHTGRATPQYKQP